MNLDLFKIISAYGFEAKQINDSSNWFSKMKKLPKNIGCWDGQIFKVAMNGLHGEEILKRWKESNVVLDQQGQVSMIDNPWIAMDLFTDGDLDWMLLQDWQIEFPEAGQIMLEDLQNFLDLKKKGQESSLPEYSHYSGNSAFLKNLCGKILSHQGKVSEAGRAFREAVEINRDFAEPYSNLGTLLWHHGQKRNAFILFAEGLLKNPHSSVCQLNFFDAGYDLMEFGGMISILKEVIPQAPSILEFRHHLAIACHRLGQTGQAQEILKQIIQEAPGDQEALHLLASFQSPTV